MDGPEKTITKLKQRQIVYRKWIAKLQVTKAFVCEKKNYYEKAFRKITAVTGISNPNDIEGLLGFIERTNDLRKTKQMREKRVDRLKKDKVMYENELKNLQNGQPNYDLTDIEAVQNKIEDREKNLRDLKTNGQKFLFQIADIKVRSYLNNKYQSGLINIGKMVGLRSLEFDEKNLPVYIDCYIQKLNLLQAKLSNKDPNLSQLVDETQ